MREAPAKHVHGHGIWSLRLKMYREMRQRLEADPHWCTLERIAILVGLAKILAQAAAFGLLAAFVGFYGDLPVATSDAGASARLGVLAMTMFVAGRVVWSKLKGYGLFYSPIHLEAMRLGEKAADAEFDRLQRLKNLTTPNW